MEQEKLQQESAVTAEQPAAPAESAEKKKRRKWELATIKYFQILLDYNLFRYGGKGEVLK